MQRKLFILALLTLVAHLVNAKDEPAKSGTDNIGFSWGASINGSIDVSSNDMSTIGIDAFFGARFPRIQMAGIGASLNIPVNNSDRMMPIYAILQTNFSSRPSLCFLDIRGGVSLNYLQDDNKQTETTHAGAYASAGIGFNLASSPRFQSFLTFGYSFYDRNSVVNDGVRIKADDVHMVTMRLGIRF